MSLAIINFVDRAVFLVVRSRSRDLGLEKDFLQKDNLACMIQRVLNDAVEQDVNQRTAVHGGFLQPGVRDLECGFS